MMVRNRNSRAVPVLFAFSILLLLLIYAYIGTVRIVPFDVKLERHGVFVDSTELSRNYRPKILIWAKQYHAIGWTLPDLSGDEGGCDVTWDRGEYPSSDAVIFYMKSCNSKDLPDPRTRSVHQAFVWWAHESPWTVLHYYKHKLKEFNNYFNWTMTYRHNSDVLASFAPTPSMDYLLYKFGRYSEIYDKDLLKHPPISLSEYDRQTELLMSKKSKLIAWVASDCDFTHGASNRLKLVQKMTENENLRIDKFGKCGQKELPLNYTVVFQTISPYKFYLAFENSFHCVDYITEKSLYNGLVSGAVPILHGPTKEDAAKVLPTGSFIHMEDFTNISLLADYLNYLDNNNTAYLEYFKWWREPGAAVIPRYGFNYGSGTNKTGLPWNSAIQDDMMEIERFGLYHLCRKLRNMDHIKKSKTIPDLNELWYGNERKECIDQ